jgi:dTMP kinase
MQMKKKGKFIVFEGIGGSGKGTEVEMTKRWLEQLGHKVLSTCEHTRDTSPGQLVEEIIKKRSPELDLTAMQLLYVVDRANHTDRVIKPGLKKNDFVLGDRYEASTVSYAPEKKRRFFLRVNRGVTIKPDLTLIIDLDPNDAVKRVNSRNDADIFDKVEKLTMCRDGYKWYLENSGYRCVWIDGNAAKEEIFEKVKSEIKKLL